MMNTLTGMSKNIKKLIISLLVMFVIISGSVYAKTSETKIIIKDINQNNEVISGFEYKIYDKNNNEVAVEKIDSSTSIVSLPYGVYTLKEVKTADGYEKSKDLEFGLPVGDDVKIVSELTIYPKHFHKPVKPVLPTDNGGITPGYIEEGTPEKPDNNPNKDLGLREWNEKDTPIEPDKPVEPDKDNDKWENPDDWEFNTPDDEPDKTNKTPEPDRKYTKTGFLESSWLNYIQVITLIVIAYYLFKIYKKESTKTDK